MALSLDCGCLEGGRKRGWGIDEWISCHVTLYPPYVFVTFALCMLDHAKTILHSPFSISSQSVFSEWPNTSSLRLLMARRLPLLLAAGADVGTCKSEDDTHAFPLRLCRSARHLHSTAVRWRWHSRWVSGCVAHGTSIPACRFLGRRRGGRVSLIHSHRQDSIHRPDGLLEPGLTSRPSLELRLFDLELQGPCF